MTPNTIEANRAREERERKKTARRTSHEKRLNQITILLTKKANECYGKFNKDNQCTYLRATKINFNARN